MILFITFSTDIIAQENPLVGSWESLSLKLSSEDTVMTRDRSDVNTLKILNGSHWMFIRQPAQNQEVVFAQGGTYEVDPENNTYTEHVEYSSNPENIGKSYDFIYKIEGDTWYHISNYGNKIRGANHPGK